MLSRLVVVALIVGLTVGVVLRTPMNRKESLDAKLFREKRFHELRVLNRVRLANFAKPSISRFASARQPLYDYADQVYNIKIHIGTPPQEIEVIPDTGETDTWVVDKTCNSSASYYDCPNYCFTNKQWCALFCESYCCPTNSTFAAEFADFGDPCAGKTLFDSTVSSTYQSTNKEFRIPIGLGNISGIVGQDTLILGDPQGGSTIQLQNTNFGQANRLSVSYTGAKFNGILGLGFPAGSFDGTVPVFQHGIDIGAFDEPVFTIWLQKEGAQASDKSAGALTFGGRDTDHCSSNITFIPLVSQSIWWFNIKGAAANDKVTTGNFVSIASLPTPFILVNPQMMTDLVDVTSADYDWDLGFYQVDCSVKFTWTVLVDDQTKLQLDEADLLMHFPNAQCYLPFVTYGGGVMEIDVVLGLPFVEKYCQTYDYANSRIGFSQTL
ncbi:putative aspartyle protease [Aphelenchoides besseyi]|nr:putative aspartyle protease [Aphelenchoides besseyi]